VEAWGPWFRHYFGVTEDEVQDWQADRWRRYRAIAEQLIKAGR